MIWLALLGWIVAFVVWVLRPSTATTGDDPLLASGWSQYANSTTPDGTWCLLVAPSGEPESMRQLKREPPAQMHRPRGKGPAITYDRVGQAIVYRARS